MKCKRRNQIGSIICMSSTVVGKINKKNCLGSFFVLFFKPNGIN